jgi:hypothetical protein
VEGSQFWCGVCFRANSLQKVRRRFEQKETKVRKVRRRDVREPVPVPGLFPSEFFTEGKKTILNRRKQRLKGTETGCQGAGSGAGSVSKRFFTEGKKTILNRRKQSLQRYGDRGVRESAPGAASVRLKILTSI